MHFLLQQAFFEGQLCARTFLPWHNVTGKLVVRPEQLLIRTPLKQWCWCPSQQAWPCPAPDAPPSCGVWEGSCCHGPSIWCVRVAHCVYPLPWAPSTEHAAPLHEAASLSFRKEQEPHLDLSPPPGPPLAGPVLAPCTSLKAIGITL